MGYTPRGQRNQFREKMEWNECVQYVKNTFLKNSIIISSITLGLGLILSLFPKYKGKRIQYFTKVIIPNSIFGGIGVSGLISVGILANCV
jgi:Na+/glutamate symporter